MIRQFLTWDSNENVSLNSGEIPELKEGEALLKVESCGICGSDIKIIKHGNARVKSGQIIGHEIAGTIIKINGTIKNFNIGDRISVGADVPCGKCYYCNNGMANCCEINFAIGHQFEGGFNQYMVLNELTIAKGPVRKISDITDFDVASLAEPLACCINGYERAIFDSFETIVIFGAGPIGMMLASLAPTYNAKNVIIVDPNAQRLNQVIKMKLATHTFNPFEVNIKDEVMKITSNNGANLVFTANAIRDIHEIAISLLARRGVVNLFGGLPKDAEPITISSNFIHYREAYITGSHGSTPEQHKKALELLETGKVRGKDFITHIFPLSEIKKALEIASSGDAIKVIIKPNL
jgi:L-iditol 2-dehydrogenase